MKLFLIRHPQPDVEKGLCYGRQDVGVVDGWQPGAALLKKRLSELTAADNVKYFHSPLSRASQLAQSISDGHSRAVDALRELDFGDWEGRLWQDIPKQEIDSWAQDIVHSAPYGGESLQVVAERVWQWWLSVKDQPIESAVLVAHSGVIKVFVSLLCQWPLEQCHRIDVGFMSVTELHLHQQSVMLKRLGAGDWV